MAKILEESCLVGENEFSFGHVKFKMSVGYPSKNVQSTIRCRNL